MQFQRKLQRLFKTPLKFVVHDNTHVFLSAYFYKKKWTVRIHWMFLKGGAEIVRHIFRFITQRDKESSKAIDQYIEDRWHWVRHPLPPIQTKGKVYDLEKMFTSLNRRFWKGKLTAKITWGNSYRRRSYEQVQMGSYSTSRDLITLHPCLDRKIVPKYVVEATVFHEMCHAAIPVKKVCGRRQIHPPAFKKLEARYPHLKKALAWEDKHLTKLFR